MRERYDAAAHMRELMVQKEEKEAVHRAERRRRGKSNTSSRADRRHVRFSPSTDFTEYKQDQGQETYDSACDGSDFSEPETSPKGKVFEVLFEHGTLGLSITQRRSDGSIRVNSASGASAAAGVKVSDTLLSVGGVRVDSAGKGVHSKESVATLIRESPRPLAIIFMRGGVKHVECMGKSSSKSKESDEDDIKEDIEGTADRIPQQQADAEQSSNSKKSSRRTNMKTITGATPPAPPALLPSSSESQLDSADAGTEMEWAARKKQLVANYEHEKQKLERQIEEHDEAIAKLEQQVKAGARARRMMGKIAAQCEGWLSHQPAE